MRPSGSSSQCSSTATSSASEPGLRAPAAMNFSLGCCVPTGNEILADGVLLSDIASIAFRGAEFWLLFFLAIPLRQSWYQQSLVETRLAAAQHFHTARDGASPVSTA